MSLPASPTNQVIKLATVEGRTHFEKSAFGMDLRFAGVSIVPGKITLAVSPASLFSRATVFIRETMAALEALYAPPRLRAQAPRDCRLQRCDHCQSVAELG